MGAVGPSEPLKIQALPVSSWASKFNGNVFKNLVCKMEMLLPCFREVMKINSLIFERHSGIMVMGAKEKPFDKVLKAGVVESWESSHF